MRSRSSRLRAPAAVTVLLAEDHADVRDALTTLLEAAGYRVVTARDGREAVRLALEERPDLVLMDVMMPECDGLAATRALRDEPRTRDIPIVVLTAMEGVEVACREAGADEVVRKPVDGQALVGLVERWTAAR